MKRLEAVKERTYPIILTNDFKTLKGSIEEVIKPSTIVIITDTHVAPLYLDTVKQVLGEEVPIYEYIFEAGEHSKHLGTITEIYNALLSWSVDRSGLILALGGGVVGDLAGFVASSYMRGIPFIQIPTTVVAQNDSSIGGKVGVDYASHKNMIGAFYQPKLIYTNITTLQTLPQREFISGLSEVLKHAFIKNKNFYDYLLQKQDKILQQNSETLIEMTSISVQMKCEVVEQDAQELGLRKILNFGHTIGHALETESQFSLLHGECVAYGMVSAAYISYRRGYIKQSDLKAIETLCKGYGLLKPIDEYEDHALLQHVLYDKKKAYGKVSFILLEQIGEACIKNDVTQEEMEEALCYIRKTCQ